jgi:hypothetical protein
MVEKKLCRPVFWTDPEDLNGGCGGRSDSEVRPELTPLDIPEDGGRCVEIPEPE